MVKQEHVNNYKTVFRPLIKAAKYAWQWDKTNFSLLCFLTIILGASAYLQYASFSQIVDKIIALKNGVGTYEGIIKSTGILLVTFLIPSILRQIQQYVFVLFRFTCMRRLSLLSIDEQAKLDIGTIESAVFQDLVVKANTRGIGIIYQVLEQGIRNLENVSGIIVASVFIFAISPLLFVVALVTTVPSFYFYKKYGTQVWWIWDMNPGRRRMYFNRFNLFFSIQSLTEIKLFNLTRKLRTETRDLLESFDRDLISIERKRFYYQLGIQIIEVIGMGFVIYYLVERSVAGTIAIGTLILAFNSYRGLYNTFESLFIVMGYQDEFGKYANWWFELFSLKPKLVYTPGAQAITWATPPTIVFENVSFQYDENTSRVLNNVSFEIGSGKKIAIVGLNGAGKTSLVKLLCRVYDPTEGRILVNGIDLKTIDITSWQAVLGVLFQDFTDFNLTVAESIGLGKSDSPVTMDGIISAARKATADTFIERYPKKYAQLLWKGFEDGVQPSKGERQKIAVARIFYRDALISVLDEPTSAIDAPSEEAIFQELESMPNNRSAVLISHRMSAIKNADRIIVLKNGSIVEEGNHRELLQKNGEYNTLYTTQAKRMSVEEFAL